MIKAKREHLGRKALNIVLETMAARGEVETLKKEIAELQTAFELEVYEVARLELREHELGEQCDLLMDRVIELESQGMPDGPDM